MKTQKYGSWGCEISISRWQVYSTVTRAHDGGRRVAEPGVGDFRNKRMNGIDADSDSKKMPYDGQDTWIKGRVEGEYVYGVKERDGYYHYEVRYDAGPGDLAWMEERDRNYVFRLMREGTLDELEPNLRTEVPALYDEVRGPYLYLVLHQGMQQPQSPLSQLPNELLDYIAERAFPSYRGVRTNRHHFQCILDKVSDIRTNCLAQEYRGELQRELPKKCMLFLEKFIQAKTDTERQQMARDFLDETRTATDQETHRMISLLSKFRFFASSKELMLENEDERLVAARKVSVGNRPQ